MFDRKRKRTMKEAREVRESAVKSLERLMRATIELYADAKLKGYPQEDVATLAKMSSAYAIGARVVAGDIELDFFTFSPPFSPPPPQARPKPPEDDDKGNNGYI